jgi:hypothetical protein
MLTQNNDVTVKDLKKLMLNNQMISKNKVITDKEKKVEMNSEVKKVEMNSEVKKVEMNSEVKKVEMNSEVKLECERIFYPKEKDSLFWCFFIIHFGHEKYQTLLNKNDLIEKQLKVEFIGKLREEKALIKSLKLDTLTNIENNLLHDKFISLQSFLALCAIEKINILVSNKINKTFYELVIDETREKYIIHREKKNGFELDKGGEKGKNVKEKFYELTNVKKPLKSITLYTIKELTVIAEKLCLDLINKETKKTKVKKELYEDIVKLIELN